MTTLRPFTTDDLFRFNNINLDALTETYYQPFYLQYLATWPEYFQMQEAPDGRLMGYMMGKVEGKNKNYHSHVTCLTVAPEFRRLGLARTLMHNLEMTGEKVHNAYFVDLYVRMSNELAIEMYRNFGYTVYRQVLNYYHGVNSEDAYDMRKALARDVTRESIIPLPHPVHPYEIE